MVLVRLQVLHFDFVQHVTDVKDIFWLMLFLIYSWYLSMFDFLNKLFKDLLLLYKFFIEL